MTKTFTEFYLLFIYHFFHLISQQNFQ